MATQLATATIGLRVWQEEGPGHIWRCAFNDGSDEVLVSFPDTAAMGDFIAEQVGLALLEEEEENQHAGGVGPRRVQSYQGRRN